MTDTNLELERFAETFKSEKDLTNHLLSLLNKMPHTQEVQITHGAQEYGKDIVFYSPDGFDNWQLNACVVKNTKITGTVDDNVGARTVFHQAKQALDTAFVNGLGERERVSKVFIVSPFNCSQTTMHSIEGELQTHFGKVEFLCGTRLLEKFKKHWPDFVLFESTLLNTYIAALQQSLEQSDPINFLASQHYILSSADKTLGSVYVRQGFKLPLQTFELLVEQANFSVLRGAMNPNDISALCEQIRFAADFVRDTQVWEIPDSAVAKKLQDSLLELATRLTDEMELLKRDEASQQRFESEIRERQQQIQRLPGPRHVIKRQHIETDISQLKKETEAAKTAVEATRQRLAAVCDLALLRSLASVLDTYNERLDEANKFAQSSTKADIALGSEQLLNYCRIRETVQINPSAFRRLWEGECRYFPETLLDETKVPTLITAPAGYGKTSFCKWNTLNDVRALVDRKSDAIPVYVALHQLATASPATCEAAFLQSPGALQLVQNASKTSHKVRMYLDGLDEVTTTSQQEKLITPAKELSKKYPTVQVVVTGRDYIAGPWLRWLTRVHLSEFHERHVTKLVRNWLGNDGDELQDFNSQLSKARTLKPLMQVPLLGTLIIAVFKKMKSLPESKVKLYEIFVELMCGGWDLAKNVRRTTRFGSNVKLGILTRLAGLLHNEHRRDGNEGDVRTAVSQTASGVASQWRSLLDEILEDGLLTRIGSRGLAFSHLSFQEYLTASELTDPTGARQQQVLKLYLSGEEWWREVLAFYVGISKRPDETEVWIRKIIVETSKGSRRSDLKQRFQFLMDAMASAWPVWGPKSDPPILSKVSDSA